MNQESQHIDDLFKPLKEKSDIVPSNQWELIAAQLPKAKETRRPVAYWPWIFGLMTVTLLIALSVLWLNNTPETTENTHTTTPSQRINSASTESDKNVLNTTEEANTALTTLPESITQTHTNTTPNQLHSSSRINNTKVPASQEPSIFLAENRLRASTTYSISPTTPLGTNKDTKESMIATNHQHQLAPITLLHWSPIMINPTAEEASIEPLDLPAPKIKRAAKKLNKIAIQGSGQLLFNQRQLSSTFDATQIALQENTESLLPGGSAILAARYVHRSGFTIGLGVDYTQYNHRFNYTNPNATRLVNVNIEDHDPTTMVENGTRIIETFNHIQLINTTLQLGYHYNLTAPSRKKGHWYLEPTAQVGYNLHMKPTGTYEDAADGPINYQDKNIWRTNAGVQLGANIQVGYELPNGWGSFLSLGYKTFPRDLSQPDSSVKTNYQHIAIGAGIQYTIPFTNKK